MLDTFAKIISKKRPIAFVHVRLSACNNSRNWDQIFMKFDTGKCNENLSTHLNVSKKSDNTEYFTCEPSLFLPSSQPLAYFLLHILNNLIEVCILKFRSLIPLVVRPNISFNLHFLWYSTHLICNNISVMHFSIGLILPAALEPWVRLSL
jgi:hypothetical protein